MLLTVITAATAIGAEPVDWRDSFVLPEVSEAQMTTDCPASPESSERYVCLTFPRDKAAVVSHALVEGLTLDGFAVGRVPEADFGFLREPKADSCEAGQWTTFVVEGETDPTKTAVMVISLREDTCGTFAKSEDNQ